MAWVATLTNTGLAMLDQSIAGGTLVLSSIKTGTGTTDSMATATDVSSPAGTGEMTKAVDSDGVRIKIRVFASPTTGYLMKQIGIFGSVDGGSVALFALMQNADGVNVPASEDFPDYAFNISLFVESSATDNIEVTVNTSSLVTMAQLNEAMSHVVDLVRTYYASTSTVSCPLSANSKTYVVWCSASSSGASGGIMDATYGGLFFVSNGKYAVIHKGTGLSISTENDTFTVTSTSSIAMASVEL